MIIAACLEGGVTRLYSEDFDAYAHVDSLQIVDPFKASGNELAHLFIRGLEVTSSKWGNVRQPSGWRVSH